MVPFSVTPPGTWAHFGGEVWPFGLVVRDWDIWSLSLQHLLVLGLVFLGELAIWASCTRLGHLVPFSATPGTWAHFGEVWPFGLIV